MSLKIKSLPSLISLSNVKGFSV